MYLVPQSWLSALCCYMYVHIEFIFLIPVLVYLFKRFQRFLSPAPSILLGGWLPTAICCCRGHGPFLLQLPSACSFQFTLFLAQLVTKQGDKQSSFTLRQFRLLALNSICRGKSDIKLQIAHLHPLSTSYRHRPPCLASPESFTLWT